MLENILISGSVLVSMTEFRRLWLSLCRLPPLWSQQRLSLFTFDLGPAFQEYRRTASSASNYTSHLQTSDILFPKYIYPALLLCL
jgi:hypothetical protein